MEETTRFRLAVQYDGSRYHGWQVQPEDRTVQGELERVVSRIFDRPTRVLGSGRTDTGVHAVGQVATVDAPASWTAASLSRALNALLPSDVRVPSVVQTTPDFHPRYDAISRSYRYRVGTEPEAHSPFHAPWCWVVDGELDRQAMATATAEIMGEHSFFAFAKAGQEERGDRCTVTEAEWTDWAGLGLELRISANRFLHHMVRYLVATLVAIGRRERPSSDLARMLGSAAGVTTSPPAPARGLFLVHVSYPGDATGDAVLATHCLPSPQSGP